ncbi:sugar ABC transporter ATP-binding protein [Tessaracoccus sp. ZS01]|uniref:sugar ABC transporter ATP-binding protein n=1 Tax=Tessaracoccus sp. ZS01 TaxID=1906324 RepID=UPI00096D6DA1|nr:sugar ABC transporter ATP-binding protein [Tessaracoccus sp. ZS01]MCG6568552.1 sugar ABC transporter ATP-binding protein [Tessaracoccus sp. ZS01]OMG52306.1 D-xylose ABC transporter ATP-binding protein [Tessaracoccus sp. ZS01]
MSKLLELKNVSKTFPGVKALQNVHLDLNAGEVLGLCGENGAGKSTLMKILTGIYTPDPGAEIWLQGQKVTVRDVNHARDLGLSIIHQELNMVPDLTVAQNLYLGRPGSSKGGFVDDKALNREASELFERLGMSIRPTSRVGDLSVARQQMVEIARALSFESTKILIMDEPTAALTISETDALFGMIRDFVTPETGLIYISHRMPEIEEITDRVSVLRDGQYIGTVTTDEVEMREIISMMVGREVSGDARPRTTVDSDEVLLKVENLNTRKLLHDINFDVRKGEVLGFAGLVGAGRTEVARAVFGADPRTSGDIHVHGKKINIRSAADAVRAGIGYLSEDRKTYGLLLEQDIKYNAVLAAMNDFSIGGFVLDGKIRTVGKEFSDKLRVKTPSVNQLLGKLSGGNQQKVVIAKWLVRNSDILIFDEPTRGIDVGAKEEIYDLIEQLSAAGKAIIVISSELPEVLRVSHRIVVMAHGHITGILDNEDATQESIMELATLGKAQLKGTAA